MANIFTSIFSFKSETKKLFNKQKVENLINYAKQKIVEYVSAELSNEEKKARVDAMVRDYVKAAFKTDNKIVHYFVEKLYEVIPTITQLIFNFLKDRICGLTRKEVV